MAKTYRFRFNAQKAEFHGNGVVGVIYGGADTHLKEEVKEMTWAEAQDYLTTFHRDAPAPSACFLTCLSRPVPPGYKQFERHLYKEHAA